LNHTDLFSHYGINDKTFDVLRLDLNLRGNKLYYKNLSLTYGAKGKLYSINSIKSKGATDFKNIIKDGQRRVQARLIEEARRSEQPMEPKVVDRQSRTFDNPAFDGGDDNDLTPLLVFT